ncbi:MAG TPA: epoxyqueuosine reductase [Candidatus Limiplasma sp.]|nr:epoxyqueuosine reductase [Candidatus Limiplasma sp.]
MVETIKQIFLDAGADLCGVANIEAFQGTPEGFHPTNLYPDCRSVVVFAKALPKGATLVSPRIVYQQYNSKNLVELDRIAFLASGRVEAAFPDAIAVPIPSDGPYEYWVPETMEGRGILSMKHAALLAGLGTLGKSTLLLNRRFGNRLSIGAVLTNLDLPTDPPAESICIPGCRVCIEGCPAHAINDRGVDQQLCRKHAYGVNSRGFDVTNCNACRTQCPMALGQAVESPLSKP